MSTVYVLTNEAMPGLVKVGKTSGPLEKRMRELYKTGVPIPFSCFYAVDVDDADFVERKIHEAFDDVRLNESREFFTIAPVQNRNSKILQFSLDYFQLNDKTR